MTKIELFPRDFNQEAQRLKNISFDKKKQE